MRKALLSGTEIYMYYTYAIFDKINKDFYIGYTSDLKKRIEQHMAGFNLTTKKMPNPELVYYEACISKKDAEAREKQLKTGFGRGYIKKRLDDYLSKIA